MKITVVGLGYVGTVAAAGLCEAGHEVVGIDVDRRRVEALAAGRVPMFEPGLEAKRVARSARRQAAVPPPRRLRRDAGATPR